VPANQQSNPLPKLVQEFFYERLQSQQGCSAHTVASYRDALRLWMGFLQEQTGRGPSQQRLADWTSHRVSAFLQWLERHRQCSVRTRNQRLAALRAFLRYVEQQEPTALAVTQPILAIPLKRFDRPVLGFLSRSEVHAILASADLTSPGGRRDHLLIRLLYNTGARISELLALQRHHVCPQPGMTVVEITGKGRKQRTVPVWSSVARQLKSHLAHLPSQPGTPLFANRFGQPLTRSGFAKRLAQLLLRARQRCPSLVNRTISPHTFRHTTAMHLLQAKVDISVIALLLGHQSPATTHHYIELDLPMKERTLKKIQAPPHTRARFKPTDKVLAFLDSL
jgi:site-specific recombinase XerD